MNRGLVIGGALLLMWLPVGAQAKEAKSGATLGDDLARAETQEKQRSADAAKRADALFAQGTKAFEQGEYPEALKRLEQAYEIYPTYRSAAALGQVELHLGRYRDAAEHLDYSLRTFPGSTDSATFHRVLDGLTEARRHVHIVNLQSTLSGAEVRVDGQLVALTPVGHDLLVEPGNRQIEVQADGYEGFVVDTFLPAGGRKKLTAELVRATPPKSAGPGGTEESVGLDQNRSEAPTVAPVVLAVGSMTTLAALGTGVALWVSSNDAQSEAQELRRDLEGAGGDCSVNSALCRPIRDALDKAEARGELSSIAFVGAAASGLLTVGLYSLFSLSEDGEDTQKASQDAVWVDAVATPGETWLKLKGTF